eukprot:gnl/TRDRNA2_/TRDRNA2_59346_c0_seq1.p1 gnl/TRDRNA2_/TRDRNA2_59346_c0~~gnl/TRDRNA2_/TRDRNA2_59346_c0_seq1.p1  ORF type:complete len:388 (-),score=55.02 gnl/TRDRNA2_/TRDRNA2_59346_c0_seq1:39-1202(-)
MSKATPLMLVVLATLVESGASMRADLTTNVAIAVQTDVIANKSICCRRTDHGLSESQKSFKWYTKFFSSPSCSNTKKYQEIAPSALQTKKACQTIGQHAVFDDEGNTHLLALMFKHQWNHRWETHSVTAEWLQESSKVAQEAGVSGKFSSALVANHDGDTALHFASNYNYHDIAVQLLRLPEMTVEWLNMKNDEGWTPLDLASDSSMAELLRDAGALHSWDQEGDQEKTDTNITQESVVDHARKQFEGDTAIKGMRDDLQGVDAIVNETMGWTRLLREAATGGSKYDIEKQLIWYGADISATDYKDRNALHYWPWPLTYVGTKGNERIKKALKQRDYKGQTPLHAAARRGNIKEMEFLISKGADSELLTKDDKGRTPLRLFQDALEK